MRLVQIFFKYIYIGLCKCFGVYKCINYIPWTITPSCKSMLISCECILKLNFFFFWQWATLISPSQKIMILWYYLNISIFNEYGTMVILFQGIFLMHIVPHLFLSRTFILNFVHHHFLSKLLQEFRYLI
jgi:hypothetical protein